MNGSLRLRPWRRGLTVCVLLIAAVLAYGFAFGVQRSIAPATASFRVTGNVTDPQFAAEDWLSWSRHLASGGTLELALDATPASAQQSTPHTDGAQRNDRAEAAEALLALESLGPLSATEKAPLYEAELRSLERVRQGLATLNQTGITDAVEEYQRLDLHSSELRILATLELLDTDEYWVFAQGSRAPSVLGVLIQRYGMRWIQRDGKTIQVMYPYAAERFPLLAELRPLCNEAEAAKTVQLVAEFNALPEARRRQYHALVERPIELSVADEAFLERYRWHALQFDPQQLTMSTN